MPEEPKFPAAWQRSVLPLLLLAQLRRGPAHGYALAHQSLAFAAFSGIVRGASAS